MSLSRSSHLSIIIRSSGRQFITASKEYFYNNISVRSSLTVYEPRCERKAVTATAVDSFTPLEPQVRTGIKK